MHLRPILNPIRFILNTTRKCSGNGKSLVSVTINDKTGIATVSMDRKPVNGLNLELLRDLNTTLEDLEGKAKGAILTSSLPTIFSGGLDIMEMYKPKKDRVTAFWTELQETWMNLFSTPYPTVALINGHSPAGGCLLAMSCEYRIMVNDYTIGLNETRLGIVAPFWFISTMTNTISQREAELSLTSGRLYTTEEARAVGLVDEIVADKEEGFARAELFFEGLRKVNPLARQLTKISLRNPIVEELREKQSDDLELFVNSVCQPKIQESLERYIQSLKKK